MFWIFGNAFLRPVFIASDCRSEGHDFQRGRAQPLLAHVHADFIVIVDIVSLVYFKQLSYVKLDKSRGS